VVGEREMASGGVAVRRRDTGDAGCRPLGEFKVWIRELIDTRANQW
jgi:threonyl-tRNA synthetase